MEPGMTDNHAKAMKARMRGDLAAALKARRMEEIAVLRGVLAAIDNAEAPALAAIAGQPAEIDRLALTAAEVRAVLQREIRERESAAAELAALGQGERAAALLRQAAICG